MEQAVRWNIKVSRETDLTLRSFLGSQGMKKGDLSKFIEDAVCRRLLQCTVKDIRQRNGGKSSDHVQSIVDQAVSEVRSERKRRPKTRKA